MRDSCQSCDDDAERRQRLARPGAVDESRDDRNGDNGFHCEDIRSYRDLGKENHGGRVSLEK